MQTDNPQPQSQVSTGSQIALTGDIYYWATVHASQCALHVKLANTLSNLRDQAEVAALAVAVARHDLEKFDLTNLHLATTPLATVHEARCAISALDDAMYRQSCTIKPLAEVSEQLEAAKSAKDKAWAKYQAALSQCALSAEG